MSKKNICLIIGSFVIAIIITILIVKVVNNDVNVYNDISKYHEYLVSLRNSDDVHSDLLIFPEESKNYQVNEFKYFSRNGLFDGNYFFYLEVKLGDDFFSEVNRIKNISIDYNGIIKKPIYEKEYFGLPCYITIFDGFDTYEYALINEEEKTITYLFNQLFSFYELGLSDNLNPYGYIISIDKRDKKSLGYNMYYSRDKYGNDVKYIK